jgi:hypothetical protein
VSIRKQLAPYTQFQIAIRLHQVRKLVSDWPARNAGPGSEENRPQEVVATIQGIATIARQEGLSGFSAVCLQLCERIAPLVEQGQLPIAVRWLLQDWSAHSEVYIRHPGRMDLASAMVDEFNDVRWGQKAGLDERAQLLRELLEPFA